MPTLRNACVEGFINEGYVSIFLNVSNILVLCDLQLTHWSRFGARFPLYRICAVERIVTADDGELKVAIEKVYTEVDRGERELVGAGSTAAKGTNSTLAQCSVDLTQKARDGLLDPLIGVRRMP